MSTPVFGQTPPEGAVIAVRPYRSTPCSLPHFDKAGQPKPGPSALLYRHVGGSEVLCRMHGEQLIKRLAQGGDAASS